MNTNTPQFMTKKGGFEKSWSQDPTKIAPAWSRCESSEMWSTRLGRLGPLVMFFEWFGTWKVTIGLQVN